MVRVEGWEEVKVGYTGQEEKENDGEKMDTKDRVINRRSKEALVSSCKDCPDRERVNLTHKADNIITALNTLVSKVLKGKVLVSSNMTDFQGRGGGLVLLWKSKNLVWVDSFSRFHIDAVVNGRTLAAWRFTGFYREPNMNEREDSRSMLHMLQAKPHRPWCCMGEFNEPFHTDEKRGGRTALTIRCKHFGMCWIFVVLWILALQDRNLFGMAEDIITRCGRDLIEGWQL
nr:hypothetical protein CFP56_13525 [Quercus suber]